MGFGLRVFGEMQYEILHYYMCHCKFIKFYFKYLYSIGRTHMKYLLLGLCLLSTGGCMHKMDVCTNKHGVTVSCLQEFNDAQLHKHGG